MTHNVSIRRLSSLWKQVVVIVLMAIIAGNLLVYILVQKRYTSLIETEYIHHRQAMQELQQKILNDPAKDLFFSNTEHAENEGIPHTLATFFQNSPKLFQLSIIDSAGRILWGKEAKSALKYFLASSSSVPGHPRPPIPKQPAEQTFASNIYVIQIPMTLDRQHKGVLRGSFWWDTSNIPYVHIAKTSLYVTLIAFGCMILLGIFLAFTRISHHVLLKQRQLEEYALSLEQAKENLRRTRKELYTSEKLASLGYLAAGIAHEIGNPLGAILGYIELLQKRSLDQKKTADILQRIQQETERIRKIIQELVHFSRPHSMKIQKFDVNHIIRRMLAQLPPIEEKQISIQLQLTEFPLFAEVDQHKLHSVFLNILRNSIDAIPSIGEICITTSRRIRKSSTMFGGSEVIAIHFSDTGNGISEKVFPHIFEPFFTTKDPGQGMGLGLSLCHRIIESFNGEIEVQSTQGVGTDAMIFLSPARKNDDTELDPLRNNEKLTIKSG